MIKVHELRVGNCVLFEGQPYAVSRSDFEYSNDHLFEPIPLSPEILIKAGFQKDQDEIYMIPFQECGLYWLETKMQLAIGYIPIINFNCASLHQLQNIYFYLTDGKELIYKP